MSNNLIYKYPVNFYDNNSTYGIASKLIKKDSSVLDIGSFDGRFLEKLKNEKNCTVTGVELNTEAIKISKKRDIDTYKINLNEPDDVKELNLKKYDYITMLDVLEHLSYPAKIIPVVKDLLKKDGTIIISIPNINHIDVAIKIILEGWKNYNDGLLDTTHTHFYSTDELIHEFEKVGLFISEIHHIVVPAGMTNIVVDHEKHIQFFDLIKEHVKIDEAFTFQKVFVFTKKRNKSSIHSKINLSKPSNYIFQRIKVFILLAIFEIKNRIFEK